jgi:DNA-binding response OmpR family regulator
MKALIVEDDLVLADVISFTLRRAGFEVVSAHDGITGIERWQTEAPDLIILDVKLPKLDGMAVCKRIRAQSNTPIIILSVQSADEDVVTGLELGADDYIAKPFSPIQLVARAKAVLRRAGVTPSLGTLMAADLTLDLSRREVHRANQEPVQLTQLECRLLEVLMLNGGQVLPADSLINSIWGVDGGDRVMLKQLIHRLRQKIESAPSSPRYIETVPGIGYALVVGTPEK